MMKTDAKSNAYIKYLFVSRKGTKILEIGEKDNHTTQLKMGEYDVDVNIEYSSVMEKQKLVDEIGNIINIFDSSKRVFSDETLIELFDMILVGKSVDDLLYFIIKGIIDFGFADKSAFFILNDKLIRLRGVVYLRKGRDDIVFDNKSIKNCTVDISKKGKIADALFFDNIANVSAEDLGCKGLLGFFDKDITIAPVYNIKGVVGAVFIECKEECLRDSTVLRLISRLVSLATEHSRLIKQLQLTMSDVAYFKESIDVSSNLTNMGKLTASVAHEIKNPLVSIGGFAKRLEKYVTEEKGLNYLKIIQSETLRLEQIVNDILTYSKVFTIKREMGDFKQLIDELVEFFKNELALNNIDLIVSCPEEIKMSFDHKKLKQVFVNLIKNSIQSIGNNGLITIDVDAVKDGINITLKDTGEGFPIEILQRAFEPFVTTKELGTGLGLSICHKIVKAHKGQIWIDNYDNGAMVKIYLPYEGEL